MPWHWEPMKDVISCDKLRGCLLYTSAARYGSNISKFVTPNVENAIHAKVEQLRAEGKMF